MFITSCFAIKCTIDLISSKSIPLGPGGPGGPGRPSTPFLPGRPSAPSLPWGPVAPGRPSRPGRPSLFWTLLHCAPVYILNFRLCMLCMVLFLMSNTPNRTHVKREANQRQGPQMWRHSYLEGTYVRTYQRDWIHSIPKCNVSCHHSDSRILVLGVFSTGFFVTRIHSNMTVSQLCLIILYNFTLLVLVRAIKTIEQQTDDCLLSPPSS